MTNYNISGNIAIDEEKETSAKRRTKMIRYKAYENIGYHEQRELADKMDADRAEREITRFRSDAYQCTCNGCNASNCLCACHRRTPMNNLMSNL